MKLLFAFVFSLVAAPLALAQGHTGHTAHASASPRTEIEEAERAWEESFASRDAAAMAVHYTEDAVIMPYGTEPIAGRAAIEQFWGGAFAAGLAGADLETVEVIGLGDAAVEEGRYTITTADGQVADRGSYVVIWKRGEDGRWRYYRDIWTSSLAPAAHE